MKLDPCVDQRGAETFLLDPYGEPAKDRIHHSTKFFSAASILNPYPHAAAVAIPRRP
jgi:hypothetical protein